MQGHASERPPETAQAELPPSTVPGAPVSQVRFSVPAMQLQRANVYMGANQRLRGLLRRALDGSLPNNTLRVGVVGGSIAWGHGGCWWVG